jgi:hypothetical protein
MLHRSFGIAMSLVVACSVPDVTFTKLPLDAPPGDVPPGDAPGTCEPACASFSTLHTCPASEPDVTCSGATPICKAGACIGLGEVTFGPVVPIATTDSVSGFGLVDVNADSHLDLVAALSPAGATDVRIGNGDRTFAAATEISLRRPVLFGDLDGDNRADLLVQTGVPALDSYLGDGTGNWARKQADVTTNASAATTGSIVDLDGDRRPDFVFVSGTSVVIHYGLGDGSFEPVVDITTVSAAAQVVIGDVDGDHHPDLVVRENAGSVETFRQTAARSYAAGVVDSAVAATELMAIADFDGDGKADLVTTTATKDKLVVIKSNGDGTFSLPTPTAATAAIKTLVVGELNGDGVPDVAIVQPFDAIDQTILAFVGRGDRTFKIVTTNVRDTGIRVAIQAVDLVGLGKTDIFYMSSSNGSIIMVPSL